MFTKLVAKSMVKNNPIVVLNSKAINEIKYKIKNLDRQYKKNIKRIYRKHRSIPQAEFRERIRSIAEEWHQQKNPYKMQLTVLQNYPWASDYRYYARNQIMRELTKARRSETKRILKVIRAHSDDPRVQRRYDIHNNKLHCKHEIWAANSDMLIAVHKSIGRFPAFEDDIFTTVTVDETKRAALLQIADAYRRCVTAPTFSTSRDQKYLANVRHRNILNLYIEAATSPEFDFTLVNEKIEKLSICFFYDII